MSEPTAPTGPDAQTLAVYDTRAPDYGTKFSWTGPYPRLEAFLDDLPSGARILDLGCGVGTAAARMTERGFKVVALDASTGMAAEAARRFGLTVIVDTFDAVPRLGQFDGIWAHFSLLHADPNALPRHLNDIHRALRPSGQFLIAMKTGEGAARDNLGRRYAYVTEAGLRDMLAQAGFTVTAIDHGAEKGFDEVKADFMVVRAHA